MGIRARDLLNEVLDVVAGDKEEAVTTDGLGVVEDVVEAATLMIMVDLLPMKEGSQEDDRVVVCRMPAPPRSSGGASWGGRSADGRLATPGPGRGGSRGGQRPSHSPEFELGYSEEDYDSEFDSGSESSFYEPSGYGGHGNPPRFPRYGRFGYRGPPERWLGGH